MFNPVIGSRFIARGVLYRLVAELLARRIFHWEAWAEKLLYTMCGIGPYKLLLDNARSRL